MKTINKFVDEDNVNSFTSITESNYDDAKCRNSSHVLLKTNVKVEKDIETDEENNINTSYIKLKENFDKPTDTSRVNIKNETSDEWDTKPDKADLIPVDKLDWYFKSEEIDTKCKQHESTSLHDQPQGPSETEAYQYTTCNYKSEYRDVLNYPNLNTNQTQYHPQLNNQTDPKTDEISPTANLDILKCELCDYTTLHMHRLKLHLLVHKDPSEVRWYACASCDYRSKYRRALQQHELRHKSTEEVKMYRCDKCSYETRQRHHLDRHSSIHKPPSERQLYKCDVCHVTLRAKSSLTAHMSAHKDPSEVRVYQCDKCEYKTRTKSCLTRHSVRHADLSELPMYKCTFCSFEAKTRSSLRHHMLQHRDPLQVQVFKCDKCEYSTKVKGSLKRHNLKHMGPCDLEMFKCNLCLYEGKTKSSLLLHIKRCHVNPFTGSTDRALDVR